MHHRSLDRSRKSHFVRLGRKLQSTKPPTTSRTLTTYDRPEHHRHCKPGTRCCGAGLVCVHCAVDRTRHSRPLESKKEGEMNFTQIIASFISEHWEPIAALAIAGICVMPETRPKTIDDWYDYIRHTLQTAIPAARAAQAAQIHTQSTSTTPGSTLTEESTVTLPPTPANPAQTTK